MCNFLGLNDLNSLQPAWVYWHARILTGLIGLSCVATQIHAVVSEAMNNAINSLIYQLTYSGLLATKIENNDGNEKLTIGDISVHAPT